MKSRRPLPLLLALLMLAGSAMGSVPCQVACTGLGHSHGAPAGDFAASEASHQHHAAHAARAGEHSVPPAAALQAPACSKLQSAALRQSAAEAITSGTARATVAVAVVASPPSFAKPGFAEDTGLCPAPPGESVPTPSTSLSLRI
ncbi:MAG: hypothetical protein ACRD2R_00655 [Terriglobales bacterium]